MKFSAEIVKNSDNKKYDNGIVEVYLDEEALDIVIHELKRLKKPSDHTHFMSYEWGSDMLADKKKRVSSIIVNHLKVTLE